MPRRPFVVPAATLRRQAGSRRRVQRSGRIPELYVSASAVPASEEVEVDVVLESVHGGILATGTVTAPWRGDCRRCLEPASGVLVVDVRELFEAGGDEGDTYPLGKEDLDLEPLVRDAVVLELPLAPLCDPACQGLCPRCGANWNQTRCDCEVASFDPRWAALDALRVPGGS